jgi:hypothetical protein
MDLCRLLHVRVHHCRPARRADGSWSTPISGDSGFPDLVIAGAGGVLFRELKGAKGKLSASQQAWALTLGGAWGLWRPADLHSGRVQAEIQGVTHDRT